MATTPDDIDEVILAALDSILTTNLITIPTNQGDTLALKVLKQADLQDDPTLAAPYVVYRPNIEEGIKPIPHDLMNQYGMSEIGGPIRFLHYYEAKFGTPLQTTRNAARAHIAIIQSRLIKTLINNFDLSGVLSDDALRSADQSKAIEGANPYLIDKATSRIFGGETTFYGEGHVWWHYPVSWFPTLHYILS